MIYLIFGENDFFVTQRIREIKSALPVEMFDLNYEELEGRKLSFSSLRAAALTVPFLGDKRIVVVRNWLAGTKENIKSEDVTALFDQLPSSCDLVFLESKLDNRKVLVKEVKKQAHVEEFGTLKPPQVIAWVLKHVEALGGKIERAAAYELVQRVGTDLWLLKQEIDKLLAFCAHDPIGKSDVTELCVQTYEEDVFGFVDSLVEKKANAALAVLHQNYKSGVHPLLLFKMISTQFKRLVFIRDLLDRGQGRADDLVSELRVHPYVAKKTLAQARRYNSSQLLHIYDALADLDIGIKRGTLAADLALDLFAIQLTMV